MVTLVIIAACLIFSLMCFNNSHLFEKYLFNAYDITHYKQYYRLFTHAFMHADYLHLALNMYVLYSFGRPLEAVFSIPAPDFFGDKGPFLYAALYLGGIIFSSLPDLALHKNNSYYRSVGASGAVNAIVFSTILIAPRMRFIFGLPGWVFGILYLGYSWYRGKRGGDNIGHNAHFYGALFGIGFTIVLKPALFMNFIAQVTGHH